MKGKVRSKRPGPKRGKVMDEKEITQAEIVPREYGPFLEGLKDRIRSARLRAAVAVNSELVLLYWTIGRRILGAQESQGYGTKIVPRLSADLTKAFPHMKGFSPRNLDYMLAFAKAWPEGEVLQEALAKLTWYHNITLLEKLDTPEMRLWYARRAVEYGWSRNVLVHHISLKLHAREGKAQTNFTRSLPAPQSDLAHQLLKDPYNFDFLGLGDEAREREVEKALMDHIQKFLLELGAGFAFVGRQVHLEVGDEDFYLDLLFYHLKLRCFVIIDLKAGRLLPEHVGKMNFYLAAADDLIRHPDDAPTIGLILCKQKNHVVAEYALQGMTKPIGVSNYDLTASLPEEIRTSLPSIEEIERELSEPESHE